MSVNVETPATPTAAQLKRRIPKWDIEKIKEFFKLYAKYNILYDTTHKDYITGKQLKAKAYDDLLAEVNAKIAIRKHFSLQINEPLDVELLGDKIKSLADVFRSEVIKVANKLRA